MWRGIQLSSFPIPRPSTAFSVCASLPSNTPCLRCDAKDVVDTPDVEKRRISNDWWRACGMGADTLVTKVDANGGNDSTGDGIADELQEIESLLWDLRGFVFILFQYYTCIGSDLCFMGLNQWSQFVDECNVADNKSKFLKKSDLDRLFIAIDTKAAMSQQKKQAGSPSAQNKHHDDLKKKVLHRVEFLVGLVHIAILRYVATGEIVKVVDALRTLLVDDIRPMLNPKVLAPYPFAFSRAFSYTASHTCFLSHAFSHAFSHTHFLTHTFSHAFSHTPSHTHFLTRLLLCTFSRAFSHAFSYTPSHAPSRTPSQVLKPTPNTFRKAACYRPEVDKTLRIFESSLRSIFTAMCLSGGLGEKGKHLSLEEWKMMLRACDIITADCSERDAAMCFAWSRMCVVDELKSDHARMRDSHLPFEGFLEALVRLSLLKVCDLHRAPHVSHISHIVRPLRTSSHLFTPLPAFSRPPLALVRVSILPQGAAHRRRDRGFGLRRRGRVPARAAHQQ